MSEALQPGPVAVQEAEESRHPRQGPARRVSVEVGYGLWAQTYDRDPNPLLALEERTVEPLLPDLKTRIVVDLGCGTGRWLAKLLARGAAAGFGLDCSRPMLARAFRKPGLAGRIIQGGCLALPLRASSADLVVCSFALGHLGNIGLFAHELARVARSGCDLFLTDLHPCAVERGWLCAFRHAGMPHEIPVVGRPVGEIQRAFAREGFELVRRIEPSLGNPERPIFEQAGKGGLLESVRGTPAIFVCHFQRGLNAREESAPLCRQ